MPFADETTGKETYSVGRYLDVDLPEKEDAVIDFNLAYNPYCAYNFNYSCPLTPEENRLSVPISAGEKNFPELQ